MRLNAFGTPMDYAPFDSVVSEGPEGGAAYWLQSADGLRLRMGVWVTERTCHGTVFVFPGRAECVEKYGRLASRLTQNGYATCVIEWRGQGDSERLTGDRLVGHVARFSDYQMDVAAMVAAAHAQGLPKPWYLIGHSMGGAIGLRALHQGLAVSACAFTAPMWGIRLSALQRLAAWPVAGTAQMIGKGHRYAQGAKGQTRKSYVLSVGFEENRLTGDPDMFDYMVRIATELPHLQSAGPSLGWLFQGLMECRQLARLPVPDLPCFVAAGPRDALVDFAAIERQTARWPGTAFQSIATARHDILSDVSNIREPVIAKICDLFADARNRSS